MANIVEDVMIIQVELKNGHQVIRDAVPVHPNVAANLVKHNGYTPDRKHGYILESDFKSNYEIKDTKNNQTKEDERPINTSPERVVSDDSGRSTKQSDLSSGNRVKQPNKPKGKRTPKNPNTVGRKRKPKA